MAALHCSNDTILKRTNLNERPFREHYNLPRKKEHWFCISKHHNKPGPYRTTNVLDQWWSCNKTFSYHLLYISIKQLDRRIIIPKENKTIE